MNVTYMYLFFSYRWWNLDKHINYFSWQIITSCYVKKLTYCFASINNERLGLFTFLKAISRKFTVLRGVNFKISLGSSNINIVYKSYVYNWILLEDPREILKFTPLNRVNFREMTFNVLQFNNCKKKYI